jgi:hypothetical protein
MDRIEPCRPDVKEPAPPPTRYQADVAGAVD